MISSPKGRISDGFFCAEGFGDKISPKPFCGKSSMKNWFKIIFLVLCTAFLVSAQDVGKDTDTEEAPLIKGSKTIPATGIRILAKPRANYTALARENGTEGTIRLRVTFLASGEIGSIAPVTMLPDGLTEQAMAAAKNLKFTPATKDGKSIAATKVVEYSFVIIYDEKDKGIRENALILEMPMPEYPAGKLFRKRAGKIKLEVFLKAGGKVEIFRVSTNLPKEFEEKAREAASKIKFKPAIHKNGKLVSQTKVIEYEFKPQKK